MKTKRYLKFTLICVFLESCRRPCVFPEFFTTNYINISMVGKSKLPFKFNDTKSGSPHKRMEKRGTLIGL